MATVILGVMALCLTAMVLHFAGEARRLEDLVKSKDESVSNLYQGLRESDQALRQLGRVNEKLEAIVLAAEKTASRDAEIIATLRCQLARRERMAEHVAQEEQAWAARSSIRTVRGSNA